MHKTVPIQTLHLFPVLNDLLIDLLTLLDPGDWSKPTIARLWTVKDIVAHLLDTNMRTIAAANNYSGKQPENIQSYSDLVNYLNELNSVWVKAMDRVSPQQLIELLKTTSKPYYTYIASLDPFDQSRYAVSWAGEKQSENWFHIAREYTEKWHHQQQIRDAVNKPGIMHRELFYPCMDTFMRGLPHTYQNVTAEDGTLIEVIISTDAGGSWYLHRIEGNWCLLNDNPVNNPDASITLSPDIAWKLFTKGISPRAAIEDAVLLGDGKLSKILFNMIAVMA